jgi:hypothetical protein
MSKVLETAVQYAAKEADFYKVREQGVNRGPRVEMYLKAVGVPAGNPWCASFVSWCLLQAGMTKGQMPINPASVCNWVAWGEKQNIVSTRWELGQRGDLFAWCFKNKWKGHIGFFLEAKKIGPFWFIRTIEGNSNEQGSREGDGVVRHGRQKDKTHAKWRLVRKDFVLIRLSKIM